MPQQMMLLTASLAPAPNQPRNARDPEKQRQLNESVALHGILQPLGVRADRKTLVWGEGRLIAAKAASLKEVPAVVLDKAMSEWEYGNLSLVENVVRSDLTQFELWQGCVRLLQANNWSLKELAKALSYDPSALTRIMSPSKVIPQAVEAFREGKIVFGHTYAISKAETPDEQLSLLNFCLSGASRDAVEKAVRTKRNGNGKNTEKVNRIKCLLPSGTIIQVTGDELDLSTMIDLLSDLIKQARKANDEGQDAKAFMAVLKSKAREKVVKP